MAKKAGAKKPRKSSGRMASKGFPNPIDVHVGHRIRQRRTLLGLSQEKLAAAIETGVEDGMQTFNQALFNLVREGRVSEKEALAKATNPQALEMNFKGIFLDEARRILT